MRNSAATKLMEQWGKVKVGQYLTTLADLKEGMAQERRKWKAEEEAAHQKLWGVPMPKDDDEMGDTILGDVTHIKQSGIGNLLTTALLSGVLGAGGVALGMYLNSKPDAEPKAYVDDSVDVGLGKIEDYLKADE